MKATEFLLKLTQENFDLEQCFFFEGSQFENRLYALKFPIEPNWLLDDLLISGAWFFCRYGKKNETFAFLCQPQISVMIVGSDDEAIQFWRIDEL